VKGKGHTRNTTMTDIIYKMPRHLNSRLNVINLISSLYQSTPVTAKSYNPHLLNHSPAFSQKSPRRRKRRKRKDYSDFN